MPTIQELFHNQQSYKYGTNYSEVKSDTETLIEQETSGIRIRSAVELPNPVVYGNEAIRITNRTTSTLDSMKSQTGGEPGDGGLIGKGLSKLTGGKVTSISQGRDAINSKLGIPTTPNPSRLESEISGLASNIAITKDSVGSGLQGTGLGQFLKDTGGGNPKTIAKQAVGKGIGLLKDKIRGKLFGSSPTIGDAVGEQIETDYTNTNSYSKVLLEERKYREEGGEEEVRYGNASADIIDLKVVSPAYGIDRADNDFKFGKSEYGLVPPKNSRFWQYTYQEPFTGITGEPQIPNMETFRGWGKSDIFNTLSKTDYELQDDGGLKVGENTYYDLIPFHIGKLGTVHTVFRSLVTGISETVSPSWNSSKFVGNPFNFYTYDGVERNVTFTLSLYCSSPVELNVNWSKITELTKMAYPSINKERLVNPPIIDFRLGDIYVGKIGFIESLSYTMPDVGNWETDSKIGYLPKYIEASITIKFIENEATLNSIYGYKKSKAAVEEINEKEQEKADLRDSRTNSDGTLQAPAKANKVNARGIKPSPPKITAPLLQDQLGIENPVANESGLSDTLGDSPTKVLAEDSSKHTPAQAKAILSVKAKGGYTRYTGKMLAYAKEQHQDDNLVVYTKDLGGLVKVDIILSNGNVISNFADRRWRE